MPESAQSAPTFNALIYGDPKLGKTGAALMCLPRALCIGVPSAIQLVGQNTLGFTPTVLADDIPRTLEELTNKVLELAEVWDPEVYDGLLIDDVTLILKASMPGWAADGGSNTRYKFMALMDGLQAFNEATRHFPGNLIQGFHSTAPNDGKRGGPMTPSSNRTVDSPPWCDIVTPLTVDPDSLDPWWPACFSVDPFGPWISGDRNDICWEATPANLREVLRAGRIDYGLRRPAGLEWLDDLAAAMAEALAAEPPQSRQDVKRIGRAASASFPQNRLHLRWGMRDGIARYVIEARQAEGLFSDATEVAPTAAPAGFGAPPPPPPR